MAGGAGVLVLTEETDLEGAANMLILITLVKHKVPLVRRQAEKTGKEKAMRRLTAPSSI